MAGGNVTDWESRYSAGGSEVVGYDWYVDASEFVSLVRPSLLNQDVEVLVPGCGTSTVPQALVGAGFPNVTAVDSSQAAVEWNKRRRDDAGLLGDEERGPEYAVMDATDMGGDVPNETFDVAADKALLDAILASGPDGERRAKKYASEMFRVLKRDGSLVVLSHGKPESRLPILQSPGFVVSVRQVAKPRVPGVGMGTSPYFHAYVCRKPGAAAVPLPDSSSPPQSSSRVPFADIRRFSGAVVPPKTWG